jgi:hypothetical protein
MPQSSGDGRRRRSALAMVAVLAALAVFQGLLMVGAPLGRFAWGGAHEVLSPPLRAASAVAILLYGVFAWIALSRAGLTRQSRLPIVGRATWVLAAVFIASAGANAASASPAEAIVMAPTALVLGALALHLALDRR